MRTKTVVVRNLITVKEDIYFNRYSLSENMVSSIINLTDQNRNLMNTELRQKYLKKIEMIPSIKGGKTAYSEEFDLVASFRD